MQYAGAVIQQLWTDERVGRARRGRRRRSVETPRSGRRSTVARSKRLD